MDQTRPILIVSLTLLSAALAFCAMYLGRSAGQPLVQAAAVRVESTRSVPSITPLRREGTVAPLGAVVAHPPAPTVTLELSPIPGEVRLAVPNRKQERNLNCEFRSAADLADYYGWGITWEELFEAVGHDPTGDPNQGFVGRSMDDPAGSLYPQGYGVHAGPVARGLRRLGINATAHHGQSVEWLKARLAEGHPVVVWARAAMIPGSAVTWQTTEGVTVQGVSFEHTFTVVGYNAEGVWVNDPYTAATDFYPWAQFQSSWAVLGNMALTIDEAVPPASAAP